MTTVVRHGGEAHNMRPDRVMRTSVIAPFVGYNPGVDVMNVAASFTMPPAGLAGYGFGDGLGPFQKLRLRMKSWWNQKRAQAFMNTHGVSGFHGYGGLGTPSPGPAPTMISTVAPQMQSQMAMLFALTQSNDPRSMQGAVADGAWALSMRRPYAYYYAG
jgi:hypothetical protein